MICAECGNLKPTGKATYRRPRIRCSSRCYGESVRMLANAERNGSGRTCNYCGVQFDGRFRLYCSVLCAQKCNYANARKKVLSTRQTKYKKCVRCKTNTFAVIGKRLYCDECQIVATRDRKLRDWRKSSKGRRAKMRGVTVCLVDPYDIFTRDGWKCQRCNIKCSIRVGLHEPRRANMDHIIPLSKGGNHVPSNIQTLCRACNIAKRNNVGGDQLLLTA